MEEQIVFYCFQGEPGESFDIPNAFLCKVIYSFIFINKYILIHNINSLFPHNNK